MAYLVSAILMPPGTTEGHFDEFIRTGEPIRCDRLNSHLTILRPVETGDSGFVTFVVSERERDPYRTMCEIVQETGTVGLDTFAISFDQDFTPPVRGLSYNPLRPEQIHVESARYPIPTNRKDRLIWYCKTIDDLTERVIALPEFSTSPVLDQITDLLDDRMSFLRGLIKREALNLDYLQLYVELAILSSNLVLYKYLLATESQRENMILLERFAHASIFQAKILPILKNIRDIPRDNFTNLLRINEVVWSENFMEVLTAFIYERAEVGEPKVSE